MIETIKERKHREGCECDVCAGRVNMDDVVSDNFLCSKHGELYNLIKEHGDGRFGLV